MTVTAKRVGDEIHLHVEAERKLYGEDAFRVAR